MSKKNLVLASVLVVLLVLSMGLAGCGSKDKDKAKTDDKAKVITMRVCGQQRIPTAYRQDCQGGDAAIDRHAFGADGRYLHSRTVALLDPVSKVNTRRSPAQSKGGCLPCRQEFVL